MLLANENIITLFFLGGSIYVCTYIVISGFLFWGDVFGADRCSFLAMLFGAVLALILKWKGYIFHTYLDRVVLVPGIICFLGVVLVHDQFDIYGMGQDEGVYRTKAIAIMSGDTSNKLDFDEYHQLNKKEKKQYREFIENFRGFLRYPTILHFRSKTSIVR